MPDKQAVQQPTYYTPEPGDTDADRLAAALVEIERLRAIVARARPLVRLVTVRMAIQAGDTAIEAAGLNPWAINDGRATGDEPVSTWWME